MEKETKIGEGIVQHGEPHDHAPVQSEKSDKSERVPRSLKATAGGKRGGGWRAVPCRAVPWGLAG